MNAVTNGIWSNLPVLQVVIPLLGAILVGFLRRAPLAFAITLAVSWVLPFIAGALLLQVLTSGPISYHLGGWAPPWGIEYRIDALNGFVLLLVVGRRRRDRALCVAVGRARDRRRQAGMVLLHVPAVH